MKVCLGGTFDYLHLGHKKLITTACEIAGSTGVVVIGIIKGSLGNKTQPVHTLQQRIDSITRFLEEKKTTQEVQIIPIQDKYGPSITGDFDAIVVSPETQPTAEEINQKRQKLGKKALRIIVVPFVLAEDGCPISSSRIRNKEITENGSLRKKE